MDINQVTKELDELFAQQKIEEIPQYLESHIAQAISENAQDVLLTLYNEIIGFYRETGQYALSIENCHKAIALMDEMGIQDTIPYATTLLNAANAHRAAGLLQESLDLYNKVRPIYVAQLKEDDMYFANFYNNLSLLYQEMKDFASAKEQLVNALYIVTHVLQISSLRLQLRRQILPTLALNLDRMMRRRRERRRQFVSLKKLVWMMHITVQRCPR